MRLPLADDLGEQVQLAIEKTTGERGDGCPWQAARDPYVRQVQTAHRHWCKGELASRYKLPLPEALMRGIEVFDSAINAISAFDVKHPKTTQTPIDDPPRRGGVRVHREPVHKHRTRG